MFHKKSSFTSVISFYQPTVHRVTGLYDNQIKISLYIWGFIPSFLRLKHIYLFLYLHVCCKIFLSVPLSDKGEKTKSTLISFHYLSFYLLN